VYRIIASNTTPRFSGALSESHFDNTSSSTESEASVRGAYSHPIVESDRATRCFPVESGRQPNS
jgi:hypothetical protein